MNSTPVKRSERALSRLLRSPLSLETLGHLKGEALLKRAFGSVLLTLTVASCVSTTPAGEKVRVTSNPDVVKGCKFLGNVKATSGWGGSAGTGLAGSITEKTLQKETADAGGNVVFIVSSGIHASGEAYRCEVAARAVPEKKP